MPKRSRSSDPNITAFEVVREATEGKPLKPRRKNPAAVALGKLGGKKGGAARAASLSPARRKEIARQAAAKRWSKPK
jgi:hypothetical protein